MTRYPAQMDDSTRRQVAAWLLLCCAMIFAMVILGGVTRLTGSGLSMVEWDPIFGVVPPLDQQAWEEVFAKYQQSPEYRKINVGMDLDGFKSIYWFEFSHRILGRSIGAVFLIPFLYFMFRRKLAASLVPRLGFAFVLGGLQALLIYAYLLWILYDLLFAQRQPGANPASLKTAAKFLLGLAAVTIVSGGFVAGLKAGHAYNTFPKMGDQWLPPAGWMLQPGWRNLFENIATVQFDHRVLATLTFSSILLFWLAALRLRPTPSARVAIHLLMLMAAIQVALGISTLLLHVPVALAATHQAGALMLLTLTLLVNHRLQKD
jgi:cytochrome c oxidase assembly protein subunit 15